MKKITLNNKATKNAVLKITNYILKLNLQETKTYIKIGILIKYITKLFQLQKIN